ncbi:uncharacterized protein LOC109579897 [Bactrocera dorsalis]|uniref:Uncharacterized protein LOC109579897 n=1 Tax=Bactrocera dorsalis TaxID=27457 RepID=A0A6J0RQ31_BACDO|nr:uncharacterized protein LOC109579897 [Bactrocera dorsalis]
MSAFKKMFNVLRSSKGEGSIMDMRAMSDKSLHSTYSGNTRPSVYTFHNDFGASCRASPLSTTSEATHINYANELTNWRQMDPNQSVMPFPGNSMSPGYYGQYGYSEPYSTNMPYQNSNFGYPIMNENQMMVPENPLYTENRLMGADSPLPTMPNMTTLAEPRNQFVNSRSDAYRTSMAAIPLDKLKRMRAAKDLYNVLNYLDSDETFLKKTSKSNKSKKSSKQF